MLNKLIGLWPFKKINSGAKAELIAKRYLLKQGLKLKEANFACKMGEIDLIMLDKEVLTFVEVRMRSSKDYGGSLVSVNAKKQQRIKKAAMFYLKRFGAHPPVCRFDVIGIDGNQTNKAVSFKYNKHTYDLSWVKQAFN